MATRIQIRRDTSTNWTSENPTLAVGELALEIDTVRIKCGNGTDDWNSLGYITDLTVGDLSFSDNTKVQLGTGNDLKIYHDGSNSYILDDGTGDLFIRGSAVKIGSITGETGIAFTANGAADLYYDNAKKLATSSTGVTVTGNINATNANVTDVNASGAVAAASVTATGAITGNTVELGDWDIQLNGTTLEFEYNGTKRMKLDSSGNLTVTGDITAFGTI